MSFDSPPSPRGRYERYLDRLFAGSVDEAIKDALADPRLSPTQRARILRLAALLRRDPEEEAPPEAAGQP